MVLCTFLNFFKVGRRNIIVIIKIVIRMSKYEWVFLGYIFFKINLF